MRSRDLILNFWCRDKDTKETLEACLYVMKALSTTTMVLPAITASTGFFKDMHNISLPFSSLLNEDGQEIRSIYSMKPCQTGIQSAYATLIKTSFNIIEQYYRVNPMTVMTALALAGFESFDQMLKDFVPKN